MIVFSHFDQGILPDATPLQHCFSLQDPQHVAEYTKDIYAHMFAIEGSFQPRPGLDLASQMSFLSQEFQNVWAKMFKYCQRLSYCPSISNI